MEAAVLLILILVCLGFALKLSFHNLPAKIALCSVLALFLWLSRDTAIQQSKTQIANRLRQPQLMLDSSVVITADIVITLYLCTLLVRRMTGVRQRHIEKAATAILLYVPGIAIFPAAFVLLVETVFALPGRDFSSTAAIVSICFASLFLLVSHVIERLIPETGLRIELLFILCLLTSAATVITTVDGHTYYNGTDNVDPAMTATTILLIAVLALSGYILGKYFHNKHFSLHDTHF